MVNRALNSRYKSVLRKLNRMGFAVSRYLPPWLVNATTKTVKQIPDAVLAAGMAAGVVGAGAGLAPIALPVVFLCGGLYIFKKILGVDDEPILPTTNTSPSTKRNAGPSNIPAQSPAPSQPATQAKAASKPATQPAIVKGTKPTASGGGMNPPVSSALPDLYSSSSEDDEDDAEGDCPLSAADVFSLEVVTDAMEERLAEKDRELASSKAREAALIQQLAARDAELQQLRLLGAPPQEARVSPTSALGAQYQGLGPSVSGTPSAASSGQASGSSADTKTTALLPPLSAKMAPVQE